jgi:hypothetical protein
MIAVLGEELDALADAEKGQTIVQIPLLNFITICTLSHMVIQQLPIPDTEYVRRIRFPIRIGNPISLCRLPQLPQLLPLLFW